MGKSKFTVSSNDAPERVKIKPDVKPGTLPPSRIPVFAGTTRKGHVGYLASEALVNGHFGVRNARLVKIGGRPAWRGDSSAADVQAKRKLAQQRVVAKGSVTKSPTKPALATRPERGG
jgi:hypothetical protein